jgi:hypothetical protein
MLARRTKITADKMVLKYEKCENKLDLCSIFNNDGNLLTRPDKDEALWL